MSAMVACYTRLSECPDRQVLLGRQAFQDRSQAMFLPLVDLVGHQERDDRIDHQVVDELLACPFLPGRRVLTNPVMIIPVFAGRYPEHSPPLFKRSTIPGRRKELWLTMDQHGQLRQPEGWKISRAHTQKMNRNVNLG